MVPGFDIQASNRRMNALIAAIQAFPDDRQDAAMRQYVECGLDKLQALEEDYYEFLGECVLLAIDNMQDVRIQSLEARVEALEHPDGPSLADLLTEAAIVFGLTLATWFVVESLGALALVYLGQQALAPAKLKLAIEAEEALLARASEHAKSLAELQARRVALIEQRRGLPAVIAALRSGRIGDFAWELGKAMLSPLATAKSVVDALAKTFAISAEADAILTEVLVGQMAITQGMESVVKSRLAYEAALAGDAVIPNTRWRNFLDNATGGLALAPAYALFDGVKKQIIAAGDDKSGTELTDNSVFLTSKPAGRILSWVRDKRMAIGEDYSVLRAALRFRKDEALAADAFVAEVAGLINDLVPMSHGYRAIQDSIRPLIVQGYEAALWWAYFQSNGMLAEPTSATYVSYSQHFSVGHILDGYVITAAPPKFVLGFAGRGEAPPRIEYHYSARYYAGLQRLTDVPAEDLYERFAKPYFAIKENAAKLPFAFDPKHYVGIADQPKEHWGGFLANVERARRLNEMRLMVIVFFMNLPSMADATSSGLLNQFGEISGTVPSADKWIALHPAGSALKQQRDAVLAPDSGTRQVAAESLTALMSDTGMLDAQYYRELRADLQFEISALRNDIDDFQRLTSGEAVPGETGRGLDQEAYWQQIEKAQAHLLEVYAKTLTAAQVDVEEVKKIEAEYEAIVEYLSAWSEPPESVDGGERSGPWRFESPAP